MPVSQLSRRPIVVALLLLALAFATRGWLFGNPLIHSDEQYYVLVGSRLLDGALPYVDIWDRKPVGLFLLYAGLLAPGWDGILAYQVAATLAAAGTAFLVGRLAARAASGPAALTAGALYLLWLALFDGGGGQTPIFYNGLVAGAGLIALDALLGKRVGLRRRGAAAMLLIGLALQLKYTCLWEGVLFGVTLLWAAWRDGIRRLPALAATAGLWVGCALAPTGAALLSYVALGHGGEFVFANFESAFLRDGPGGNGSILGYVALAAGGLAPLAIAAALPSRAPPRAGADAARLFLVIWSLVALAAIASVDSYKGHYFLPLLVPLCAACAPAFAGRPRFFAVLAALGAVATAIVTVDRIADRGDAGQARALADAARPAPGGTLFLFGSEPILHYQLNVPPPTPYAFRGMLTQYRERLALGVDPAREVARILATRPDVVVVRPPRTTANPVTYRLVARALAANYRLTAQVRVGRDAQRVYRRR